MSDEPIEDLYFNWLCAKVLPPHEANYRGLLMVLHRTEFTWIVIGDDNREADGIELRLNFLYETHFYKDRLWFDQPCSVLEMLIALCYHANFQTDIPLTEWFWLFIRNLWLEDYRRVSEDDIPAIQEILENFIHRNYQANGNGGLFPLLEPHRDQRKVEIWYQFCDYVQDRQLI